MSRIASFLAKPPRQKYEALRFRWMRLLAGAPYVPVRYRLAGPERVRFWWSRVFMAFVPGRPLLEYAGSDAPYLSLLWRLLRPGMVVLDVGAFHGLYAVIAARRAGQVIAFEPSRRDRRRLRLHVAMNRLSNVAVEPYAVSDAAGESEFYVVRRGFTTMNSLRPPATADPVDRVVAHTIGLDEYCASRNVPPVDLVKIDVEGGELALLRGAAGMLENARPIILCEVLDWVTAPWGYPARHIVSHLAAREYEWFELDADGRLRRHVPRDAYPDVRNYLAVPRERRATAEALVAS